MKLLRMFATASAAGLIALGLFSLPAGHGQGSQQAYATFSHLLAQGDRVALNTFTEGVRLIVVPDDAYWQKAREQEPGLERGTVVGAGDDYISIQLARKMAPDPLVPQGKTELIHLPVHAIESITTFVPSRY